MGNLRPETDAATLGDILTALLAVTDSRDLEVLLRSISLDAITTTDDEQERLRNAIYAAAARCWTRRWPTDCCGD